jgi:hypothetical protein
MQSPKFLYLIPTGEADPAEGGARRFTNYEMASRLSYFLWDSTPDQNLLDAAGRGELVTSAGLATQVGRMLGMPRGRGLINRFLAQSWNISRLDESDKDKTTFPLWSAALLSGFREEFRRQLDDIVFTRQADLREIFDGRNTFVNRDVSKLYGMTAPSSDFVRAPLDTHRSGLFTSGAAIAANSPRDRSSPTKRGVFVLERLLCQGIPAPPANVDTSALNDPKKTANFPTVRAKLDAHRSEPACANCHGLFDPLGYALENFDGIGAFRTTENGVTIDATGTLGTQKFDGGRDLANWIHDDPRATHCMARRLYEFGVGHVIDPGETGVVDALDDGYAGAKYNFQQLAASTVTSAGFRYMAAAR